MSGKESKVKEYLEAEMRNSDLGEYVSQVLIPTEKVYQVRNGKKIVKERSYLPGYVLVEAALIGEAYFDVTKDEERRFVVSTAHQSQIEVYGTGFNVEAYAADGRISTTLVEGSVGFSLKIKQEKLK